MDKDAVTQEFKQMCVDFGIKTIITQVDECLALGVSLDAALEVVTRKRPEVSANNEYIKEINAAVIAHYKRM